jgi:restriction endonuclease Mrr
VSRLVARLQRGEYGIFITTSYYTKDAQKEVYEDSYPVRLFSGSDIVSFLNLLGLISNKTRIKEDWLARIKAAADVKK